MLNWHFKIRTVYNKQNHSILIRPIYLGQAKNKMVTLKQLKHIEFGRPSQCIAGIDSTASMSGTEKFL